jgi:hypothetical protein
VPRTRTLVCAFAAVAIASTASRAQAILIMKRSPN